MMQSPGIEPETQSKSLVEGERSHHCTNPAPQGVQDPIQGRSPKNTLKIIHHNNKGNKSQGVSSIPLSGNPEFGLPWGTEIRCFNPE